MADTVKKSRIVSENECFGNFDTLTQEDTSLQDIINEEFTQRLKNCMSDEPPDIIDNHEEIGQSSHVLKNGSKPDDLNNTHSNTNLENDNTDDENSVLNNSNINLNNGHTENIKFIDTQKFIDTEIETEIKNNVILSDDLKNSQVIIPDVMISSEPDDEINEEVTAEVVSPVKEEIPEVQEIEDDGFVNKEVPSPETEELDEITPPYDNITVTDVDSEGLTAKERFLSTVTDLDDSNVEVDCISNASSTGSNKAATVKDRMFLSTNSACLLFTQTVVQSPMLTPNLTPTEENYDFLQSPTKEETKDAGKVDILVEKGESFLEQLREETPQNEEIIKPENLEIIGREESVEMSEISAENSENDNSEHFRQIEDIKEDIQMFVKEQILDKKSSEEEIIEPPIPSKRNIIHDQIDINNEGDGDGDDDKRPNVSKVSEISKIFTSSEQNELNTSSATKISPIALQEYPSDFETIKKTKELFEQISKSPENIVSDNMKKSNNINASENDTCSEDDTNDFDCNDSTTVTSESTFVETRTESNSGGEKILKKKKSKKSKKDSEKENISVSDVNNINNENEEENLSHVSVKTLCRSFSDLTTISTKNKFENLNTRQNYGRAKSMSDIRRADSNLENVFTNVSVKYLRECFDNLTNMTTNKNNCLQNKLNITKSDVKPVLKTSDRIEKLKSSFSKFDALSKKTVLHVRSSDAGKAQEKFNGTAQIDTTNCKACQKQVFQMEQIKAEKAIWHKNCFRCKECNKQLNVDTYQSNEGVVYCKPHFKALFTPKAVEDEPQPIRPRKHELIIRENQPLELPPDVVRASDKPDLGLEELQNLNVKERFQVFEHHENSENSLERTPSTVNVKRSPSILSKLAKFQQKGMDIGVGDDSLNGVPVEESSSEAEDDEDEIDGTEDPNLIRARRAAAQREIPLHFNNMSEVMSKWESGNQMTKEERREERKQEIQSIRSRLFMGKQGKMKELYQQAVAESESGLNVKKSVQVDTDMCEGAKSLKDKFERGESLTQDEQLKLRELEEDKSVFESGISKKSRSIFLELDANASKPPQLTPLSPSKSGTEVRRAREAFMAKQASEDVIRASDQLDDVVVKTADISNKFKFFESYKEQEKPRKQFRITPPRDGQLKMPSPDRDVYRDPDIVRSDEQLEDDSLLPKKTHTATKMLNIFRQMEENLTKKDEQLGPKPLKRFTPPPEGEVRREESGSEEEVSESEEENEDDEVDHEGQKIVDDDLIEAQKAARAKHLRAKFEKWEANEIQREQNNSSVNLAQEIGEGDSQIESAKSLRARFESMRDTNTDKDRQPRVKVNRFV